MFFNSQQENNSWVALEDVAGGTLPKPNFPGGLQKVKGKWGTMGRLVSRERRTWDFILQLIASISKMVTLNAKYPLHASELGRRRVNIYRPRALSTTLDMHKIAVILSSSITSNENS